MPGLYTGASGLWGGFAGLLYGSTSLSTPPGLLADAAGFSPFSLFANGEQGVWYQNSDFSTLFQDAAGTTPVTALEQPVGLRLDKSKGLVLGPELVTNGTFNTNTTGWTAQSGASIARDTSIFTNGGLLVTANGGAYSYATQIVGGLTAGVRYVLSASVYTPSTNATNNRATIGVEATAFSAAGSRAQVSLNTEETISIQFVATATTQTIYMSVVVSNFLAWGTAGSVAYFDNISVRELPGNHAFQTTNSARPVLSARKNLLVNTATLSTQNVTVRAVQHVLSFWGTGTITLSGVSTAGPLIGTSIDNRVYIAFTPTAGTLTLTVSGTVSRAQLEEANEGA